MTTTLRTTGISNSLTVNDLKRSVQQYTEGLGFKLEEEYKMEEKVVGVRLSAGESTLMLTQDDFAKGRDRVKGLGMRMYIETDQDLVPLARQARAAGLAVEGDPAPLPWGPMGFSLADADGFKLTISAPSQA
jgi:uncharacterized glyoxalase superfamily protein PhnB